MNGILTLAFKDLRLLWRDRFGMFWVFAFPLIMALLFGSLYSGGGGAQDIKIGVIDQDQSARSGAYLESLEKTKALQVTRLTLDQARQKVRQGDLSAYVLLEKGFGELNFGGNRGLPLQVGVDPSKSAVQAYLQGILVQKWFESLQDIFAKPQSLRKLVGRGLMDIDKSDDVSAEQRMVLKTFMGSLDKFLDSVDSDVYSSGEPLGNMQIKTVSVISDAARPHSSFDITFPSGILWGLIGCATAFGISIVSERNSGTLRRIRLSPLGRPQIMAGKGVACFIACLATSVLLLVLGKIFFKVHVDDPLLAAMALVSVSLCFVGIMMLISVLGKTERAVSGAGWAVLLVMAMFGGCMMPLAFMPGWMQAVSNLSPVKWGVLAIEGAVWRQFSYAEMLPACGILIGVGALFFAVGVRLFSRSEA